MAAAISDHDIFIGQEQQSGQGRMHRYEYPEVPLMFNRMAASFFTAANNDTVPRHPIAGLRLLLRAM
jgi:hypothetical protein